MPIANDKELQVEKALCAADLRGHEKVVQLLVEKGADLCVEGYFYKRAVREAARGGYKNLVLQLLVEKLDCVGDYGSGLCAAVLRGHDS